MAETSLSPTYLEFRNDVAQLYHDLDYSGTGVDTARVNLVIEQGERNFYFPPAVNINGRLIKHRWSFLQPIATLTTSAVITTGTITYDHTGGASPRIITFTSLDVGGDITDANATDWEITFAGTTYPLATFTATDGATADVATLTAGSNPGADVAALTTYELARNLMNMPENYGGIRGGFTYDAESSEKREIINVGEGRIRKMRGQQTIPSNYPRFFGIRPNLSAVTTTGQRFDVVFYPSPDAAYTLTYRYDLLPEAMSADGDFGLCPMPMMELLRLSIMARTEQYLEPAPPQHRYNEMFMRELEAAVRLDQRDNEPEFLGYNGDSSNSIHRSSRLRGGWRGCIDHVATYNNVVYNNP